MVKERILTASEIGTYAYCPRAWWYDQHKEGLPTGLIRPTEAETRGIAVHQAMETDHVRTQRASRLPYVVVAVVGLLVLAGVVIWFLW
jgi:hypothetical protein